MILIKNFTSWIDTFTYLRLFLSLINVKVNEHRGVFVVSCNHVYDAFKA